MGSQAYRLQVILTGNSREAQAAFLGLRSAAGASERGIVGSMGNIAKKTTMVGGVVAGVVGFASVKAFANFDSAMTKSLAIMGTVGPGLRKQMEQTALVISKTTTFSAKEAADAYYGLASSGMTAKQAMAALPQVAKFAQAGAFDLAKATDLAVTSQNALGMSAKNPVANLKNLTTVTDVLTDANNNAIGTVEDFTQALTNKAGAAARVAGKPIQEVVAVLEAFAQAGIKGKVAGMQYAIVMRDLQTHAVKPKHAAAMKEYGVSVFDANGKMRNMAVIIGQLEAAFKNMNDKQRKQALLAMGFTDRSVNALLVLLGTSKNIAASQERLYDAAGATHKVAQKQLESFSAQLLLMKNRIVSLGISIGSKLAPNLIDMAKWFEKAISKGGELRPIIEAFADAWHNVSGAFGKANQESDGVANGLRNIVSGFADIIRTAGEFAARVIPPLVELASLIGRHTHAVASMVGGYMAAKVAFVVLTTATKIYTATQAMASAAMLATTGSAGRLKEALISLRIVSMMNPWVALASIIGVAAGAMIAMSGGTDRTKESMQKAAQAARDLKQATDDLVGDNISVKEAAMNLSDAQARLAEANKRVTSTVDKNGKALKGHREALRDQARAQLAVERAAESHRQSLAKLNTTMEVADKKSRAIAKANVEFRGKIDENNVAIEEQRKILKKGGAAAELARIRIKELKEENGKLEGKIKTGNAQLEAIARTFSRMGQAAKGANDNAAALKATLDLLKSKTITLTVKSSKQNPFGQYGGGVPGVNNDGTPDNDGNPLTGKGKSIKPGEKFSGGIMANSKGAFIDALGRVHGAVTREQALDYQRSLSDPSISFLTNRLALERAELDKAIATQNADMGIKAHINQIKAQIKKVTANVNKLRRQLKSIQGMSKSAKAKRKAVNARLKDQTKELKRLKKKIEGLGERLDADAQAVLDAANAVIADEEAIEQMEDPYAALETDFASENADMSLGLADKSKTTADEAALRQSQIERLRALIPSLTGDKLVQAKNELANLLAGGTSGGGTSTGGTSGGTDFNAIFRNFQRIGSNVGMTSEGGTLTQAQRDAMGITGTQPVVVVNQTFPGADPNMFAASQAVKWSMQNVALA